MKKLVFFLFGIFSVLAVTASSSSRAAVPQPKPGMNWEDIGAIVIMDGGRKKPLDTFARETVQFITGTTRFQGFVPLELLFSWLTQAGEWEEFPILDASYVPLQKQVGLQVEAGRVAPGRLRANAEFNLLMQAVAAKQQDGGKLSELENHAGKLLARLNLFYAISSGAALRIVPASVERGWESLESLAGRYPNLQAVQQDPSPDARIAAGIQGLLSAYFQNDQALFQQVGFLLAGLLREKGKAVGNDLSEAKVQLELRFNSLQPFFWAWIGYAVGFFILLCSLWLRGRGVYWAGIAVLVASLLFHVYGFYLRCRIAGRPPVTNMYESVIWVALGIVFFGLVFEFIYRPKYYALAGSALGALGLILAGSAPSVLDPSIDPLVPVLRNNFWLTVHVLTITLSYAAFALGLGVAHFSTGYYLFKPQEQERINRLNYFLYRSLQVGVVLLAAGTILGGVWANASWGRFWGWDPKEVWALIALLGYLSILHGRHAGWLKGFGLAVGSILAFLLVLMAWYGVNFILGVGLHSYGFSSGGAKFVTIFVGVELIWVGLAILRYKFLLKRPWESGRADSVAP
jgi:cytochrome c-type biogenesis protein CcsB